MESRQRQSGLHNRREVFELTGYELRLIQGLARGKQVLAVSLPKSGLEALTTTAAIVVGAKCQEKDLPPGVCRFCVFMEDVWRYGPYQLIVVGAGEIPHCSDLLEPDGIVAAFGGSQISAPSDLAPSQFIDTQNGLGIWRLKPHV